MYDNNFILDGRGSTSNGKKLVKKLNLSLVTKVTITKQGGTDGGPANVDFYFLDGDTVTIINSFGIGYGGTGPWGLHDVLIDMGIPRESADTIFTHRSTEPLEFTFSIASVEQGKKTPQALCLRSFSIQFQLKISQIGRAHV